MKNNNLEMPKRRSYVWLIIEYAIAISFGFMTDHPLIGVLVFIAMTLVYIAWKIDDLIFLKTMEIERDLFIENEKILHEEQEKQEFFRRVESNLWGNSKVDKDTNLTGK